MIVILLCSFYLVNLILAIVAMSYDDCQKREQAEIEEEYAAALVCLQHCASKKYIYHPITNDIF